MLRKHRTGLSRLGRYLRGRWLFVAWLIVVATGSAAAQSGGWLLVRDAIDNGIAKGDRHTLTVVVAVYLVVNLLGWLCQVTLIRGLARIGQGIVLGLRRDLFDHLTSLSLRYFSEQRAGWIIARADQRRGRDLRRALPGPADARLERRAPAHHRDRPVRGRLAAGARRDGHPAAHARLDALVPGQVVGRAARGAKPDRRRDRPDRRVGVGHGDHPGVQPRARTSRASSTS